MSRQPWLASLFVLTAACGGSEGRVPATCGLAAVAAASTLLEQFTDDPTVILLAVLVALDVILGIAAALKAGTFRFVLISDFLRADVLGKLVPYYAVWAAVHLTGDVTLGEFGVIEETTGAAAAVAIGASVFNSLRDLGLAGIPDTVAADDPTTPG